jgi:hypothetical protein
MSLLQVQALVDRMLLPLLPGHEQMQLTRLRAGKHGHLTMSGDRVSLVALQAVLYVSTALVARCCAVHVLTMSLPGQDRCRTPRPGQDPFPGEQPSVRKIYRIMVRCRFSNERHPFS